VPVSFSQAALGAQIKVPTLEGEHALKVPEGTQTGQTFRLKGKGVPSLNGHGRGDLYVEVKIQTPKKLTKKQRELLQQLNEITEIENRPEHRPLLDKVKDLFG
jgi:molecular chaperone DnaJ